MNFQPIKYRLGKFRFDVDVAIADGNFWFRYRYNASLKDDMKSRFDLRWNPDKKLWYGPTNEHNFFQLKAVMEKKPYEPWDQEIEPVEFPRTLQEKLDLVGVKPYAHQLDMFTESVHRKQKILAAEPGTGKTLVFFGLMYHCRENDDHRPWIYVGPKSAINSVKVQIRQWKLDIDPIITTYESLQKLLESWNGPAPHVFFDECSRIKNPSTKRTNAAKYLAESCRKEGCYIIEASGTPAPKVPTDWWSLAHVAQPGFLRESNVGKLRRNLAFVEKETNSITGGLYEKVGRWRDTDTYCDICGLEPDNHKNEDHSYRPGKNKVTELHNRLKGLVSVYLKKDCLDLPDRTFEIRRCEVSLELMQAARTIARTAPTAAQALIALRQLSDGFRYKNVNSGETTVCDLCSGTKEYRQLIYIGGETETAVDPLDHPELYESKMYECPNCGGTGEIPKMVRETTSVDSPKDQIVFDLMEEDEDLGRLILYAGFQGSLDKCVSLAEQKDWHWIKVDGRGYTSSFCSDPVEMLSQFQDPKNTDRIVFIGNPASAGMGLNLTAARTLAFYSNSFNYEDRAQGLERNFRIGQTKAVRVVDIFNLPTDEYVLNNLNKKKRLLQLTMGEVLGVLE